MDSWSAKECAAEGVGLLLSISLFVLSEVLGASKGTEANGVVQLVWLALQKVVRRKPAAPFEQLPGPSIPVSLPPGGAGVPPPPPPPAEPARVPLA